ncbi:cation efflux protein [Xylariomycetidae sp. FL0641]|nr:cation efflux protein [Xylariomycetidae sp. FL0641]
MARFRLTSKQKLIFTIAISFCFFIAEISVAFSTKSLALLADAFHYMNDLIGFIVALGAVIISEKAESPQNFSFGWARAQLLGAYLNGVFLLALGVSIFLQSIERFIFLEHVQNPKLVLIMGSVGLALNILSATVLHEFHGHDHGNGHSHGAGHSHGHGHAHSHSHDNIEAAVMPPVSAQQSSDDVPLTPLGAHTEHRHTITKLQAPGRDLGMMGVMIHVLGDALNNIGVIVAALVIWLTDYSGRFYADPGVSMGIALMILVTSLPLVWNSGKILMQSAPNGLELEDVKHDLEKIPGIESVHELHIWRLDQQKVIASAHVVVPPDATVSDFMAAARTAGECLHAYGIHSVTVQPELASGLPPPPPQVRISSDSTAAPLTATNTNASAAPSVRRRRPDDAASSTNTCQIACGNVCENLTCCSTSMRL